MFVDHFSIILITYFGRGKTVYVLTHWYGCFAVDKGHDESSGQRGGNTYNIKFSLSDADRKAHMRSLEI